jgi:hypothetical protein
MRGASVASGLVLLELEQHGGHDRLERCEVVGHDSPDPGILQFG